MSSDYLFFYVEEAVLNGSHQKNYISFSLSIFESPIYKRKTNIFQILKLDSLKKVGDMIIFHFIMASHVYSKKIILKEKIVEILLDTVDEVLNMNGCVTLHIFYL